jgi:cell division protein ZapA
MSTVSLSIGPKTYAIACADGEEAHITTLGAIIAEQYAKLGTARGPLEAQNLLFAALFLADELADTRKRLAAAPVAERVNDGDPDGADVVALRETLARVEAELEAARQAPAPASSADPRPDLFGSPPIAAGTAAEIAEQLEALATRIEASAQALEAAAANA